MKNRIHRHHLSLVVATVIAGLGGITAAQATDSHFYGRWTISDDKPAFTAKGRLYKTFDVAPCGNDFCGMSVSDNGGCGETLFRFFTVHQNNDEIVGHGRWGSEKKKLVIDYTKPETGPNGLYVGLGDNDMDPSAREGSMPTFEANYKRDGDAKCKVGGANS